MVFLPKLHAILDDARVALFGEPLQRRLARLRQAWGQDRDRPRNLAVIALYHFLLARPETEVDPETWADLNMDEVFGKVDHTSSMPGRQLLLHRMRTYEPDERVLAERTRQQDALQGDPGLREAAQLLLARLDGPGAGLLAPLIHNHLPQRPWFAPLLQLSSGLSLLCLGGLLLANAFLLPALFMLAVNIAINETYGRRIGPYLSGFSELERLLGVLVELAALPELYDLPQLRIARQHAPVAAKLRKGLGWLVLDRSRQSGLAESFLGYLNLLFLVDIQAFLGSIGSLRRHQAELAAMLEAVADLDATLAVASYRQGHPCCCVPQLGLERRLQVRNLRHPLLAEAVGNPLELDGHSALITGSNMAGKTTFLRTLGVNMLLAQTLHFCLADAALLPRVRVRSSLRREDSLADGKSYYFAELERLLGFVRIGAEAPHLLLIDEIFRGTNTVERLAAATAVLRHLASEHVVLVTTHDIELAALLADRFEMFHFSEHIQDGVCAFDYRIQAGPTRSRNAIRLMELNGYPAALTREARTLADSF